MSYDAATLLSLLPALYQLRDAALIQGVNLLTAAETDELAGPQAGPAPGPEQQARLAYLLAKKGRGPLGSLLAILAEQLTVVESSLDQMYDDQFIETCSDWVIPYIGDLIGYKSVHGVVPQVASTRAEIGHTISFRRRKGTAAMLEQLARDVTGWGACAVEFFQRLGATQYMNHLRPHCLYSPDLRRAVDLLYVGTAFDKLSHTVDVRRIATGAGRYNIQNIGIFLWRLTPYSLTRSPAVPDPSAPAWRFWMSPLGNDIPLFNDPATRDPIKQLATPLDVPDPIRMRVLDAKLAGYYGQSLKFQLDGVDVDVSLVRVCNLADGSKTWTTRPSDGGVVVDPERGRVVLTTGVAASSKLTATFHHGFSAAMGGGEYTRAPTFALETGTVPMLRVPDDRTTIQAALNDLGGAGIVEITNSGRYEEALQIDVATPNSTLELRAADGFRPTLLLTGETVVRGAAGSQLALNGLLVAGNLLRVPAAPDAKGAPNQLKGIAISHCTFVPGWTLATNGDPLQPTQPSLAIELPEVGLTVEQSIVGGLRVHVEATATISDSIVDSTSATGVAYAALDGAAAGGTLNLEAVTVIGKIHAQVLQLVSDSALVAALAAGDTQWSAPVVAERRQLGCVRFTYLPPDSRVPSRYECQPPLPTEQTDTACASATVGDPALGPVFRSLRYGTPAYCQMEPGTADAIRRGASDEGEMGAFHQLYQPRREINLTVRLGEYLRVGLESGIFYAT
jgi:hypothetical protein